MKEKLRIVFWGSGEFGTLSLKRLLCAEKVLAVVTSPDKPAGRGLRLRQTPIKEISGVDNLSLFQPENIDNKNFLESLKSFSADLFVIISYGKILTEEILDIPHLFSINLHPSLLPEYRGASPIERTIIAGEEKTGISVIKMDKGMDSGPIILQKEEEILHSDTAFSLSRRLSEKGSFLLLQAINLIKEEKVLFNPQTGKPTYAPKLRKEEGLIDWRKTAKESKNLVRGFNPWPGTFTYLKKEGKRKLLKVWEAEEEKLNGQPGELLALKKEGILIGCGKGSLLLKTVQLEGKKRVSAGSFISGYPLSIGTFPFI